MRLTDEELQRRREILCERSNVIKDYIRIMGVPYEARDDIFQDVCIIAYNHIASLKDMDKLNSWLYKITIREVGVTAKEKKRINERELHYTLEQWNREELSENLAEPEEIRLDLNKSFSDVEINDMVKSLKYPAPEILRLHFVEGFTLKEIGTILGIKSSTVRSIEARSYKKLKDMINEKRSGNHED